MEKDGEDLLRFQTTNFNFSIYALLSMELIVLLFLCATPPSLILFCFTHLERCNMQGIIRFEELQNFWVAKHYERML